MSPEAFSSLIRSLALLCDSFSVIVTRFSALFVALTVLVIACTKLFTFVTPAGVSVESTCQFPLFWLRTRTILFGVLLVSVLLWNRNSTRFASCGTLISICLLPAIVGDTE